MAMFEAGEADGISIVLSMSKSLTTTLHVALHVLLAFVTVHVHSGEDVALFTLKEKVRVLPLAGAVSSRTLMLFIVPDFTGTVVDASIVVPAEMNPTRGI